jgi:polyphenol oxidase
MEPFIRHKRAAEPELYMINAWCKQFPGLTAGFTGRDGGVSEAPFNSLNLGLHVGDNPEAVIENRKRLADAVGIPFQAWTYGEQVHGCDVQQVEQADAGRGTCSREDAFQAKDAFITAEQGICLAGLFADCVPLLFVDPEHSAVGLAHAGWKGTVLRVAEHTVRAMAGRFGSRPEAIHAAIGPSIGSCCYEVDEHVISRVKQEAGVAGDPYYAASGEGRYMLNLQEINRQIMIEAGIMPHHIEITMLCTGCTTEHFFSHRKENGTTGRMAAWIGWKQAAGGND